MNKNDSFGRKVKREITRAMLERLQSMDLQKSMAMFGAKEPLIYDDVEETLNVAYVNRDEVALAMDIFKPKDDGGKELPVIIAIHGGGLFMGDRSLERPYCRLLAHKGYLVFSLEYRLVPKAILCEQLDDVCAGLDRVGQMLVDYDVDFSRIFMVADSAGAYLAAYVTAMHGSEKLQNAIGHKPSRMVYAAVGYISGMFYTNKTLQELIYGDRRNDEKFLKYMNIEHPEIIQNLPPAFLITSCGDTFNNYSIKFNQALKKRGRTSKLVYLGNEELQHIFPITNPEHPRSLEVTDKMLAWFEQQADIRRDSRKNDSAMDNKRAENIKRIASGEFNNMKVWKSIKERTAYDEKILLRAALVDCTREYTYEQMFEEWENYARVYSALDICAENNSRTALCGVISAETVFALFGLNMTGAEVSLFSYPDFLPGGMWKTMIEKEKITDIIIADIMVTPEIRDEIEKIKEEFGIRNVIYMHSLMGGPTVGPAELTYNELNYHMLRRTNGAVFMNDLLEKYQDENIKLDESEGDRVAFIAHTSGTTMGTRKPLPFTDKAFNEGVSVIPKGFRSFIEGKDDGKPITILQLFDFSSVMALSAQLCSGFAAGEKIIVTYFGFMHPKFIRAIDYYNVSVLMTTGFMVDKWLDRTDIDDVDFSSLKVVGMSGGYVSPEKMEKYTEFFRKHGFKYSITSAYGASETGGKPIFAPKENKEDILGYVENSEEVRIKDEKDGEFYKVEDGPRTGVLYRLSQGHCENELDNVKLFEYTEIDGKDFLCTHDLVRVNEDGSISFAGRADKYFVNNSGKEFDSGLVDMNMAEHKAIDRCAVVPVMDKRIHDTVPVLYVVPAKKGEDAVNNILKAFKDVYVKDKKIEPKNLPTQFMIVDDIPINANGKLDIYRITRERLAGDAYNLVPVLEGKKLIDIKCEHVEKTNSFTAGTIPAGMENNSAYNIFDIFNADSTSDKKDTASGNNFFNGFDPFKPWKMFMPDINMKDIFKSVEIPESVKKDVLKYGNRISGLSNGRKWIDHDFEE
ncbi:AMP-binding protein [Butyrivibrio sp. WCE2006]|uniref:AMP-binding protein n=1 Tax=Butyrivibrio sp. WCE2006 TaxID=1410611 RepID=UPI0005D24105|nr:AMP-binding protein [Butyrivibrio sp. WCE2006]